MKTFLAASCLVLLPFASAAQSLGNCGCDNVREMRDRYCSAKAARAEYDRIERFFRSEEKRTGQSRAYSNADKRMINQGCVQEAINRVTDKGVDKATALTMENHPVETMVGKDECRVVVTRDDGNACLRQIVEAHEGMHREACLWRNKFLNSGYVAILSKLEVSNALGLHYTGDTKYLLDSGEFAFEEAVSYATEMQLISAKWKELQQNCIAKAFEAELFNEDTAGKDLWDNGPKDASGNHIYKMYDLSNDPCPSRPPPPKSACTLK